MVGERFSGSEVHTVRWDGAWRSENVGTSNRNMGEMPVHRKPKGSLAMEISQGLVGPKAMAKAVANGHAVNIRQPRLNFYGETEETRTCVLLDLRHCVQERCGRKIHRTAFNGGFWSTK